MSSLDRVIPQAMKLPLLNRLVQMIVLRESDLTWLRRKSGFKGLRNVYYYYGEAARWARLLDEDEVQPISLGRKYVRRSKREDAAAPNDLQPPLPIEEDA